MAITGVDTALAGLLPPYSIWKTSFTGEAAGEWFSPFYTAGNPGAATPPGTGQNGAALSAYAGQLPFPVAVAGTNVYLADLTAVAGSNVGCVALCDRLWHNSGYTMTTTGAQLTTFPGLPSRDYSGGTNGVDVMLGLEVSTVTGNAGAVTTITASYTDSDGAAGNTATITSFPATAVPGHFSIFNLAAGDKGIRSLQSISLGTSLVSGAIHAVLFRVVAMIGTPVPNTAVSMPLTTPRRMYDQSVPMLLYGLSGTAGGAVAGTLQYTQV